ncbi:hypothetical protein B0H10DRAFT_1952494 [Mycena sp. CBHHK59/15]|nr:hypothetical protein B0H10DRAFT_1971776 [Mycena sp. CBHHK59/15]KAJ6612215.1 hypothetical protein B0H10DRAFT_1952494 [Mycena sp. CBHHK59/15]
MTCSASPSGAVKPTSALAHTRTPLSPRTHTRLPPAPVNLRWELAAHSPSYDDEIACARPIPRIDVSNPYGAPLLLMPMPPAKIRKPHPASMASVPHYSAPSSPHYSARSDDKPGKEGEEEEEGKEKSTLATTTLSLRRQLAALNLRMRFGVFRAKRRIQDRMMSKAKAEPKSYDFGA